MREIKKQTSDNGPLEVEAIYKGEVLGKFHTLEYTPSKESLSGQHNNLDISFKIKNVPARHIDELLAAFDLFLINTKELR